MDFKNRVGASLSAAHGPHLLPCMLAAITLTIFYRYSQIEAGESRYPSQSVLSSKGFPEHRLVGGLHLALSPIKGAFPS